MKTGGFLMLVSGWLLVLSALVLLKPGIPRNAFVLGGVAVEAIGLALVFRAHKAVRSGREPR